MDSIMPISQPQLLFKKPQLAIRASPQVQYLLAHSSSSFSLKKTRGEVVLAARAGEKSERNPSVVNGFTEEMRMAAIKLHTRDQAKQGEQEPDGPPLSKWEPRIGGCLKFLVDSKLVYDTMEMIIEKAAFPECECALKF